MLQYRKRYELLQLAHDNPSVKALQLQYRKRYELLQLYTYSLYDIKSNCYNTASGMSCCNTNPFPLFLFSALRVTTPQAV